MTTNDASLRQCMNFYRIKYQATGMTYIEAEHSMEAIMRFGAGDYIPERELGYEIVNIQQVEATPAVTDLMVERVQRLSAEEWTARFKPIHETLLDLDHLPEDVNSAHVWTRVDTDNKVIVTSGILSAHGQGYWLCAVPVPEGEFYESEWAAQDGVFRLTGEECQ